MKLLLFIPILFLSPMLKAQDLDKYQWKNRIILIITENEGSDVLNRQLQVLKDENKGLKERKLKIFQISPGKYRECFPREKDWTTAEKSIYELKKSNSDYEILLLGLDGGVKLRQTEILETEKLFDLIDSMPMRKAEMQRKKN